MHVVILLAGIADSKRPLERPSSGDWKDLPDHPTTPFKLSPFDEAALEIALKLRDEYNDVMLTAIVSHGAQDLPLLRAVAAYRLDRVIGLQPEAGKRDDPEWLAEHALAALSKDNDPPVDLVLIGREHGDLDDGMTPAFIAAKWGWPFLGMAESVQTTDDKQWLAERTGTMANETFTLGSPAIISVTNAKSNRLRHPLMKNVMLAKQQKFEVLSPQGASSANRMTTRSATPPATVARGSVPCRILQGSIQEQARQLATLLTTSSGSAHVS